MLVEIISIIMIVGKKAREKKKRIEEEDGTNYNNCDGPVLDLCYIFYSYVYDKIKV